MDEARRVAAFRGHGFVAFYLLAKHRIRSGKEDWQSQEVADLLFCGVGVGLDEHRAA